MSATIDNVRALVVTNGKDKYDALKHKSSDYLQAIEKLAYEHRVDLELKCQFAINAKHSIDINIPMFCHIVRRIENLEKLARQILTERAYPNVPSKAAYYYEDEPAVTEDQYKLMTRTLAVFCRVNKE